MTENYIGHTQMHESFPGVDSGSTQVADAGNIIPIRRDEAADFTKTDEAAIRGQLKNQFRLGSDRTNVVPIRRPQ